MNSRWVDDQEYNLLQTKNFVKIPQLNIDVDSFMQQIEPYKPLFRNWGEAHTTTMFRKGISVVNMSGSINDEIDPCCYPQDQYNKKYGTAYYDNHYTVPTEILNLPCFDSLSPIKPYMIRSAILWWKTGSFFYPHIDTRIPTTYIRLWGTNAPNNYLFTYQDGTNHTNPKWEPGQLYLAETCKMHYAESLADDVFTFFFCVDATAYDILMEMTDGER